MKSLPKPLIELLACLFASLTASTSCSDHHTRTALQDSSAVDIVKNTFVSVSVGEFFACGVKTNGSIACWGRMTRVRLRRPVDYSPRQAPASTTLAPWQPMVWSHVGGIAILGQLLRSPETTSRCRPAMISLVDLGQMVRLRAGVKMTAASASRPLERSPRFLLAPFAATRVG